MPIYTKKGDKGTTGLIGSTKDTWTIPKSSPRIRAIGCIDEVNSFLGLAAAFSESVNIKELIYSIQRELFKIGSILAGSTLKISASSVVRLERTIDSIEKELPSLSNFILPGGSRVGAMLHIARTVTRRAEREVAYLASKEKVPTQVVRYINRLSDFIFVLARKANKDYGSSEVVWKNK